MRVDPARIRLLLSRAELEVSSGALPSCQVALARDGELIAAETFGAAGPDTRYILQSAGRTVVASAVWLLLADGRLKLDERVAEVIPEFGTHGKDAITVEHLLTHTGGFPYARLGFPKMIDRTLRLQAFSDWTPNSAPGTAAEFHLTSAGWVIAEIVERRTGRSLAEFIATEIAGPLGLTIELGVEPDRQAMTVAPMVATDTVTNTPPDPWGPWYLARPEVLAAGEPSHSVVGSAADVAFHYQALIHSGLWPRAIVDDATRLRTSLRAPASAYGAETTTGIGLFVLVRGPEPSGFFPAAASPTTFGCPGQAYQTGFYDPETGLSFAFLTNGYPRGADDSLAGRRRLEVLGNLALDCVI